MENIAKQIEEMAKILANHRGFGCDNEDCCDMSCQVYKVGCLPYKFAEALYNAGYRKQSEGEWIVDYDSGSVVLSCSLCDEHYWVENEADKKPNFCPNCGAKMKGE